MTARVVSAVLAWWRNEPEPDRAAPLTTPATEQLRQRADDLLAGSTMRLRAMNASIERALADGRGEGDP